MLTSVGLGKLFGTDSPYPSHTEVARQASDDFARLTVRSLPKEWAAMVTGRPTARQMCHRARRVPMFPHVSGGPPVLSGSQASFSTKASSWRRLRHSLTTQL